MIRKQLLVLAGSIALVLLLSPIGDAVAAITPEGVQSWFDAKFVFVGVVVGLLWKYLPWLKAFPNAVIPWLNTAVYIFGKIGTIAAVSMILGIEPAYAGGSSIGAIAGIGLMGAVHAICARQGWEGFFRPIVEVFSVAMTNRRHPGGPVTTGR